MTKTKQNKKTAYNVARLKLYHMPSPSKIISSLDVEDNSTIIEPQSSQSSSLQTSKSHSTITKNQSSTKTSETVLSILSYSSRK